MRGRRGLDGEIDEGRTHTLTSTLRRAELISCPPYEAVIGDADERKRGDEYCHDTQGTHSHAQAQAQEPAFVVFILV